jgi:gas vesicle protein
MGKFSRGLFIGGVVGAVTGLLSAPGDGKKNRKVASAKLEDLSAQATVIAKRAGVEAEKGLEKARPTLEKTEKALEEAIKAGKSEAKEAKTKEEAALRRKVDEAGKGDK